MPDTTFHQFKLRMPRELFEQLEAAASRSNRSVSAEITNRLERTFTADAKLDGDDRGMVLTSIDIDRMRALMHDMFSEELPRMTETIASLYAKREAAKQDQK